MHGFRRTRPSEFANPRGTRGSGSSLLGSTTHSLKDTDPEVSAGWEDNAYEPGRARAHAGISAFECPVPRSRVARDLMMRRTIEESTAGARHRTNPGVHDGAGHRSGDRPGGFPRPSAPCLTVPNHSGRAVVRLTRREPQRARSRVPRRVSSRLPGGGAENAW